MKDFHLKHILVVDDEEEYRAIMQKFLQRLGYDCGIVSNAMEGLEKLHDQHFDLVVSDIKMERMDGIQFMREAQKSFPHLEFIIMTGHSEEYSYSDIIAAGATDFIIKPFEMGKLKSKLDRIQREKQTLRQLQKTNEWLSETNRSLEREVEINASISELSLKLIGPLSLEDVSCLTLKYAQHLTESTLGFVGYIDQKSGCLFSPALSGDAWDQCLMEKKNLVFEKFSGLWGWVLEHREALLTNSPADDARSNGVPPGHIPIHRFLGVPAIANDTLLGMVALANSERDYTQDDLAVVRNLAALYALAIQSRATQEKLREANEHLENVFENAADGIGIVDERGRFIKWNRAAETLFDHSFEELQGKSFSEIYADKAELENVLKVLRRDGFVAGREISIRGKEGRIVPARISIRLLRDDKGKVVGSVAVASDLSDIKEMLAQLRSTNQRLEVEMIERERMAEELRKARDELEVLVAERTERLSKAGDLLKRSINRLKEITEE